ncbi:hypothetical protein TSAR_011999 [Trichomalopsis sarcophagae]|uniref:Uncharacterized protein n=1 Tax=Trichomalopsis sarcophagae TaxID=543379 RepID=A0A232ERA9_9HYME|nr:hypothetical protein TSAR_011999 [Trichomalopsis sarcophagae]
MNLSTHRNWTKQTNVENDSSKEVEKRIILKSDKDICDTKNESSSNESDTESEPNLKTKKLDKYKVDIGEYEFDP